MKTCSKCNATKPFHQFSPGGKRQRYDSWCKECRATARRARYKADPAKDIAATKRWIKANPERRRAIMRAAYRRNPEPYKERARRWERANSEKLRERHKQRYREDPEYRARILETKRRSRKKNPQINRDSMRRRRATQKKALTENYKREDIALRDTGRCGICGTELYEPIELDHIIPISRGGDDIFDNVQLVHKSCNSQKCGRPPSEHEPIQPIVPN